MKIEQNLPITIIESIFRLKNKFDVMFLDFINSGHN